MALIDDIEFYGRAVDAREMDRGQAVQLLVEASRGGLTARGATETLAGWTTARARYERILHDTHDTLRALNNGRPVPEHVTRHMREHARASAYRIIRRQPEEN